MFIMKACIEYDGTNYFGWQRQKGQLTVQEVLEGALGTLLGTKTTAVASGRTDTGVHAINQYVSFKAANRLPDSAFLLGLNTMLPDDIRIKSICVADPSFHACVSARRKRYLYRILNRRIPTALDARRVWHIMKPLDLDAMRAATAMIVGEHDFASFRAALCSRLTTVRTVYDASWTREGDELQFSICANGFLHNMVRILVGTLAEVGMGRFSPGDFQGIMSRRDRRAAGRTAPPHALYLLDVYYDDGDR